MNRKFSLIGEANCEPNCAEVTPAPDIRPIGRERPHLRLVRDDDIDANPRTGNLRGGLMSAVCPQRQSRRIVVLGASGFLGGNLARYLAMMGHDVLATARRDLSGYGFPSNVSTRSVDVGDLAGLIAAFTGREMVYHFASSTNLLTNKQLDQELDATLTPAKNILAACKHTGVQQIVFPSSGCVYAFNREPRIETSAIEASSPYAYAKLKLEELLLNEGQRCGCRAKIFRIANAYGPKQEPRSGQGVIPYWLAALRQGHNIVLRGDGKSTRDFVFINDVCQVLESVCQDLLQSEIYNLGTGNAVSLNELLITLGSLTGRSIDVSHQPQHATDFPGFALSPEKLLKEMPQFRFTPLRAGLVQVLHASESASQLSRAA